jgi:hypothetical protein
MEDEDQTLTMPLPLSRGADREMRVHFLEVVAGDGIGDRHVISEEGAVVGRRAPADLVLLDSKISRAHCRLAFRGEDLLIKDLGSTNGTFLDGVRLQWWPCFRLEAWCRWGGRPLNTSGEAGAIGC